MNTKLSESRKLIADETERIIAECDRLRAVNAELVAALECVLTRWGHLTGTEGWTTRLGHDGGIEGGQWVSMILDKAMRAARAALAQTAKHSTQWGQAGGALRFAQDPATADAFTKARAALAKAENGKGAV